MCFCARLSVCPRLAFVPHAWGYDAKHLCMSWPVFFAKGEMIGGRLDVSTVCGKAFTHLSCAGLLLPALTG